MGMVFQSFGLMPHLTVIDNIAFPLKLQGKPEQERYAQAQRVIELVGLEGRENNYPKQLSGGQQQRVGIARSLAVEPDIWFLDEPFSALDFEMTLFIREKLQEVFMQTGTTMLLVSHDLEEAVYLADQVLLLTKRPTRVAEILPYGDARPRTVDTLSEPAFIQAKKRSLEIFQREVRR
mgnify:CR=1 FL=1